MLHYGDINAKSRVIPHLPPQESDGIKDGIWLRSEVLVTQLCLTLCNAMNCSPPGSSVPWILQARILEQAAISFSRGTSWRRDQTWVSDGLLYWQVDSLPLCHLGRLSLLILAYKSRQLLSWAFFFFPSGITNHRVTPDAKRCEQGKRPTGESPAASSPNSHWRELGQTKGHWHPHASSGNTRRFHTQLVKGPETPLNDSRGKQSSVTQTRRGLTLLSQLCRDPAVGVRNGEEAWGSCLQSKWGPLSFRQT